jgi:hypothetical protein
MNNLRRHIICVLQEAMKSVGDMGALALFSSEVVDVLKGTNIHSVNDVSSFFNKETFKLLVHGVS